MADRLRLKDFQVRWDGVSIILLMSRILLRLGNGIIYSWCGGNIDQKLKNSEKAWLQFVNCNHAQPRAASSRERD